jgi:hypothetical protein
MTAIPMDSKEWIQLFYTTDLRQFFLDEALAFAREKRLKDIWEDCYQEAWLRMGLLPGGMDLDYYKREGSSAMRRYAEREFIARNLTYKEIRNARARAKYAIVRAIRRRKSLESSDEE